MRFLIGITLVFCLGVYAAEKHPVKVRRAKAAVKAFVLKALE